MQIAVIQHVLRGDDHEDAVALANAAADATDMGAEVVVFPRVPVLADGSDGDPVAKIFEAIDEVQVETVAYINTAIVPDGAHFAGLPILGGTALFVGDACMDYQELLTMNKNKPQVAILAPGAENDMQAEAVEELAIGLSTSLAGLIIVAEAVGAEPGEPGHGGSAIIHLGEVVAEAMGDGDETLTAEFESPVPQPEPRALLPQVPTILSARLAHHHGQKPDVDYPADLS
jgi:predicted amidohydrolase